MVARRDARQFETEFVCEIDPVKSAWIQRAFSPKFVFEDMMILGTGYAKDLSTGDIQEVPKAWLCPKHTLWTDTRRPVPC